VGRRHSRGRLGKALRRDHRARHQQDFGDIHMNQNLSTLSFNRESGALAASDHILLFPNGVKEGRFSGVLTLGAGTAAGQLLVIGDVTYTFRAALTTPPIANEILIGASAQATLLNV